MANLESRVSVSTKKTNTFKIKNMGEFGLKDLEKIYKQEEIMDLLVKNGIITEKSFLENLEYEKELKKMQTLLYQLQAHIIENNLRLAIIFEGRDAAGKGGTIKTLTSSLNPKKIKTVALPKPTEAEQKQWYLQRYIQHLPQQGEIVFFDRSWYNRAVVEPIFGFCNPNQYKDFMENILLFENLIQRDGIVLIKIFLEISKEEQAQRLKKRQEDPLKRWKIGPLDQKAQEKWEDYSHYIQEMLKKTSNTKSPWVKIKTDSKNQARLHSMYHILTLYPNVLQTKELPVNKEILQIYGR